jgi:hypothetical protein
MALIVEYHPLFWADIEEQAQYLEQEAELGEVFLEKVENAIAAVKEAPLHYSVLYGNTRHVILEKFRRHIIHYEYFEREGLIRFYGLFHGSENPIKWVKRL